jgi:glycosyltransferase involved in cell wall biosynthesis
MRDLVSVIVMFHSGIEILKTCIDSLITTLNNDDEILIVVNNSNKTIQDVSYKQERVKYLRFSNSIGYSMAANEGVKSASNELIVLSDHDLIFQVGWVDSLANFLYENPEYGAASCLVVNPHTGTVLDYGISFSHYNGAHPGIDLPINHALIPTTRFSQAVCAGGLMLKRSLYLHLGGCDPNLGSMYNDLDLCLQIKKHGLKVAAIKSAKAFHFGGDFSLIGREYKSSILKADIKGYFMKKNSSHIIVDLNDYYKASIDYFHDTIGDFGKYFIINMMNVVDPDWYESIISNHGAKIYDRIERPSRNRDAGQIGLFEVLGHDIMIIGAPIAYFVDRFPSITKNLFWWNERNYNQDIVIDRNGTILCVSEVLNILK